MKPESKRKSIKFLPEIALAGLILWLGLNGQQDARAQEAVTPTPSPFHAEHADACGWDRR